MDIDAAVQECQALSIAYARHVDFGDYDRFLDLFTVDAVLHAGARLEGREAIRQSMGKRPKNLRSRHVLTNIFIDLQNDQEATGISYLTLYRHIGDESLSKDPIASTQPAAIGHYADRFRLTDDGWKISERILHFAFRSPDHF